MRKKFIPLHKLFRRIRHEEFTTWVDKLTFFRISILWFSMVAFFGALYSGFSNGSSYLMYPSSGQKVTGIFDHIYFSFITATSTGFGDIVPFGLFRTISVIEVVFGLILFALVTSKIISIKQNVIIEEIYDISFSEKIHRIRSSLLLFRQHLSRIIVKVENGEATKREINDLYVYISQFDDTLRQIKTVVKDNKHHYSKKIDPMNSELIFHSITKSFVRINELIRVLNLGEFDWKRDINISFLKRSLTLNRYLIDRLEEMKVIGDKTINDIKERSKQVTKLIINEINKKD